MNTTNTGHTPTPWKIIRTLGTVSLWAGQREVLAYSHSPDAENVANVEFIATACNEFASLKRKAEEHAELVKALAKAQATLEYLLPLKDDDRYAVIQRALEEATAALVKAGAA
jgi:hypothetical protein